MGTLLARSGGMIQRELSSKGGHDGGQHVHPIEPELVLQMLRSGRNMLVVDVRTHAEFNGPTGHIEGARSIPLAHLVARIEEIHSRRSELVVVVSERGLSSRSAALQLAIAGFGEAYSLDGGMARWKRLGLPVAHC